MQTIFNFFHLSFITPLHIFMTLYLVFFAIWYGSMIAREMTDGKPLPWSTREKVLTGIAGVIALPGPQIVNYLQGSKWPMDVVFTHALSQFAIVAIVGGMVVLAGKLISR